MGILRAQTCRRIDRRHGQRKATVPGLAAGVAPSTASGHLAKLVEGKLISVLSSGRRRYFRLTIAGRGARAQNTDGVGDRRAASISAQVALRQSHRARSHLLRSSCGEDWGWHGRRPCRRIRSS